VLKTQRCTDRTTESFRLKVTSGDHLIQPPAPSRVSTAHRPGSSGLWWVRSWKPLQTEISSASPDSLYFSRCPM